MAEIGIDNIRPDGGEAPAVTPRMSCLISYTDRRTVLLEVRSIQRRGIAASGSWGEL